MQEGEREGGRRSGGEGEEGGRGRERREREWKIEWGGWEGGKESGEGSRAESASPCSVAYRRRRVKVVVRCLVFAAPIPCGSKSVPSPGSAKKGEWKLDRDSKGRRDGSQVVSRRRNGKLLTLRSRVDPRVGETRQRR